MAALHTHRHTQRRARCIPLHSAALPGSCSELEVQDGAAAGGLAGKDVLGQCRLLHPACLDQTLEVALLHLQAAGGRRGSWQASRRAGTCTGAARKGVRPWTRKAGSTNASSRGAGSAAAAAKPPIYMSSHLVDKGCHVTLPHQGHGAAAPPRARQPRADGARRLVDLQEWGRDRRFDVRDSHKKQLKSAATGR